MIFDVIFVGAFVVGWLACAYLPWLLLSVLTRGEAGLGRLPLSLFAGLVCAMAVPLLGLDNSTGLWLSFLVAFLASAALLALARLALDAQPGSELADATTRTESRSAAAEHLVDSIATSRNGIGRLKDIHRARAGRAWPGGAPPTNRPSSRESDGP